jgi:uncharacterized protein
MTTTVHIQYVINMKFTLDQPAILHVIRGYAPGVLRIGDREFTRSVIVSAQTLIDDWRPQRAADLTAADLEPAVALQPEILLLGSGPRQVFPAPDLLAQLYAARIGFEIMDTGAACRTYNVLVAEGREVAAALIIA